MTSSSNARILVVTPAHNEAEMLRALAESMVGQTLKPARWIIVDDRSSDGTTKVARSIGEQLKFVTAIRRDDSSNNRTFSGKVAAFADGYDVPADEPEEFIACVDADVVLPSDYFDRVIKEFRANPRLGVCGGVYVEPSGKVGRTGAGSVPGAGQVFRRVTFEEIGGFRPLDLGGEDAVACAYARMKGWVTRALPDLQFRHTRSMGSSGGAQSRTSAAFQHGRQDWHIGFDPVFEIARMFPRVAQKPYLIAVVARLAGFIKGALTEPRQVDQALLEFLKTEQRKRLLRPLRWGRV
jgi:biofilm PGA synthesis N-glycosyltransferase PgaC